MSLNSNPDMGFCPIDDSSKSSEIEKTPLNEKPVTLMVFTDPISARCWFIEPILRRFQLEYGNIFQKRTILGGLLPSWDNMENNPISSPEDVSVYWEEMHMSFGMPITGGLWKKDPLFSSYPPSIAYHKVFSQYPASADSFLRLMREFVFMEEKNIARPEVLQEVGAVFGFSLKFNEDDENHDTAVRLFETDLMFSRRTGIRGFPTLTFLNAQKTGFSLMGIQTYEVLVQTLKNVYPYALPLTYCKDNLFSYFSSYTSLEYSYLKGVGFLEAEMELKDLVNKGRIKMKETPAGPLWVKI